MNDLYPSLLGIGGAFLVAVIAYNKWQEYKAKKNVERAFSTVHDDVLMNPEAAQQGEGSSRREPSLDHDANEPDTDTHQAAPIAASAEVKTARRPVADLPVDEMVDCTISLMLAGEMRGEKILRAIQSLRHVGNKAVHYVARRHTDDWETVAHGESYTEVRAGAQMANRSGTLNELEYSELVMRLRQIADELDAELDMPDMTTVMHSARALHQLLAEFDAQLSVNVHSNGAPWAINTLLAALERQGFDVRPDGRLVMPDGEGGILFTLSTNVTLAEETTARLTLLLDVPRVAPERDGYGAMVACAKMLAARLGGTVVDDGNQVLTDATLAEIGGQVQDFYRNMDGAGVSAGSQRAMRLFN